MGSISNGFKTVPNQNDFNFKLFQIKMISISNGFNFTAFQIKTISISNGCSKSNGFNFKCQKVSISGSLQDWTVRRPSGPVFSEWGLRYLLQSRGVLCVRGAGGSVGGTGSA